jgi:sec-independent protein translocase protein TatA
LTLAAQNAYAPADGIGKEKAVPFGPWEIVIFLIILVVIFGAGRLSQVGGAVGRSVREFRTAVQEHPKAPAEPPVPAVPPVICAKCQTANPAANKFCSGCGAPLLAPVAEPSVPSAPADNTCPSCATVNPTGQVFCGQCGTRLARAA